MAIQQRYISGGEYRYSIIFDGDEVYSEVNRSARQFYNVKVYISGPFYPAAFGYISKLELTNFLWKSYATLVQISSLYYKPIQKTSFADVSIFGFLPNIFFWGEKNNYGMYEVIWFDMKIWTCLNLPDTKLTV